MQKNNDLSKLPKVKKYLIEARLALDKLDEIVTEAGVADSLLIDKLLKIALFKTHLAGMNLKDIVFNND